jgi:membrane dipeptidase
MNTQERAQQLTREHGVIDLHADTLLWVRHAGYDMGKRHQNRIPTAPYGYHVDIPRLQEGGVKVQLFGIVTLPVLGERGCAAAAVDTARLLEKEAAKYPDKLAAVKTRAQLDDALSRGLIAGILSLEGAHALENDIENLQALFDEGLRSLGLAHFSSNSAAPCAYGVGSSHEKNLSDFGREVVAFCDAKKINIDLAHIGRTAFLEVCRNAPHPRIVSHTGLFGANPHWRNIDDEQVKAIAETGGVVGVMFAPRYLGGKGADKIAAHIKHGINIAGEDAIALGSDFDGFIVPTRDVQGAEKYPVIAQALLDIGVSEQVVAKVMSQNALRVLRDCLP